MAVLGVFAFISATLIAWPAWPCLMGGTSFNWGQDHESCPQ